MYGAGDWEKLSYRVRRTDTFLASSVPNLENYLASDLYMYIYTCVHTPFVLCQLELTGSTCYIAHDSVLTIKTNNFGDMHIQMYMYNTNGFTENMQIINACVLSYCSYIKGNNYTCTLHMCKNSCMYCVLWSCICTM